MEFPHYLSESSEGKAQVILTASRFRVYKQANIDEADVIGNMNLFNGKNGAAFQGNVTNLLTLVFMPCICHFPMLSCIAPTTVTLNKNTFIYSDTTKVLLFYA